MSRVSESFVCLVFFFWSHLLEFLTSIALCFFSFFGEILMIYGLRYLLSCVPCPYLHSLLFLALDSPHFMVIWHCIRNLNP